MNPEQNSAIPEPTPAPTANTSPPPSPIPPATPQLVTPAQPSPNAAAPAPDMITPHPMPQSNTIVGSQLPASYTKQRKNRKPLLIKSLVGIILLGAILAALVITDVIPIGTFKTITYDNGKGQKYSLKFYRKHTVKGVQTGASLTDTGTSNLKQLVSKVEVNGMTPLTIWLTTSASTSGKDCTALGLQKAFDAKIDLIGKEVPVCSLTEDGKDIIYLTTFSNAGKTTLAYISQDFDFQKLISSPENARAGLKKVGLTDYRDDIKTILASVKPLD